MSLDINWPEDMPLGVKAMVLDDRLVYGCGYAMKVDGVWHSVHPSQVEIRRQEGKTLYEVKK